MSVLDTRYRFSGLDAREPPFAWNLSKVNDQFPNWHSVPNGRTTSFFEKDRDLCRSHVARSRRWPMTVVENIGECLATCATQNGRWRAALDLEFKVYSISYIGSGGRDRTGDLRIMIPPL